MQESDVLIVGGGPAGATTAIVCAGAGLRVTLLTGEVGEYERPGETLHPGIEPLLTQLGVGEAFLSAGFLRHPGIRVSWNAPERYQPYGADTAGPWLGFQAWRADLDALLLRHARSCGACVLLPAQARDPLREGDRIVGVAADRGVFRARFVVDASGSRHWLARRLGLPILLHSPPLIARYGYAEGDCPALNDTPSLAATNDGWLWMARVRPALTAWVRLSLSPGVRTPSAVPELLRDLRLCGPARGADVGWRQVVPAAGPGFFLVGDAAAIVDPTASHGVLRAIMSGMMAADHILKARVRPEDEPRLVQHYTDWLHHWFRHDVTRLRELYACLPSFQNWPPPRQTGIENT